MSLLEQYPELLPLAPTQLAEVMKAASEDGHRPTLPTDFVRKGGEIIGAVGLNSIPLYTLWLHSQKVKPRETVGLLNVIENTYRREGRPMLATIINAGSPFLAVAQRLGYVTAPGTQLFLKRL